MSADPQQCNVFWAKLFPFLRWRHRVDRGTLRSDLMAALTGAIVVLPQGVAFAAIAGMPPEYGLYAAMVPALIAALFGSSWHLVSGPTTAASIVMFASLGSLAEPASASYVALALTLTLMVGVLQLVMGLARLGTLVNFISHSVVIGFTAGAAILIAVKQIPNFFGVHMERGLDVHEIILQLVTNLERINPYVAAVGGITLLTGILVKRFAPKFPYMLAAMLVGSLASVLLNRHLGTSVTGITTVGALPASLPPLSWPDFRADTIKTLAPAAVAATLLALTEAISIARALAARSGQRLDGNQEFIGQGLSNIVGSFFSSYVATGSFNRSGVNYEAGARTPLAAAFAGVMLMGIVPLVAPLAANLPHAAMAGLLFLVAWGLIDFHHIKKIFQASRSETSVLSVTFLGTLFLELEFAILMGIMLSLALYLNRTSKPVIHSLAPDPEQPKHRLMETAQVDLPECPQLKIVRVNGSLFFGAVNHVGNALQNIDALNPEQRHVLIIGSGVNFIDLAGAEMLAQEAERRRAMGGGLYLCDVKESVCRLLRPGGHIKTIGDENIFRNKQEAIREIHTRLNAERCSQCQQRIFNECGLAPVAAENRTALQHSA